MTKNLYRNNRCVSAELSWPIQLEEVTPIQPEKDFRIDVKVVENKLYGASVSRDYMFCMDIDSRVICWEKRGVNVQRVYCPVDGENGRVYCAINSCPACLDVETGQEIWKINKAEFLLQASSKYLYCRDLEADNIPVVCRSKETGEVVWRKEKIHGYLGNLMSENGIVLLQGGEGIHVCRESTGEVLWDIDENSWRNSHFPERKFRDYIALGPLVNGVFFVGFDPGLLAAFQIETGELLWFNDLKSYLTPHIIIHHKEKLYFDKFQGWGTDNHLTCVDAQSGELYFRTDENFTPEGTYFPLIVNDYLVAGGGNHLSFFDLNKREFVWRYKPKIKKNVAAFSNDLFVYKDLLISYSSSRREIYWFRSKK